MKRQSPYLALIGIIALLFTLSILLLFSPPTSQSAPPPPSTLQTQAEIETALEQAIDTFSDDVLAFLIYDVGINHIQYDATGQWAVVWLDLFEPTTGDLIPTEPGLVVAYNDGIEWHVILQADPEWAEVLAALPPDLMPEANKVIWLDRFKQVQQETPSEALGGYLLPWAAGLTKYLSRSISHGGTGYYAFDFGDGTMFPLYASKGGTVHLIEWTYPNGFDDDNCAHSNYIILEDTTTDPVTYQLYLHLAYDSIPEDLRVVGTPVLQGQFIGNADDTGCSSGHHLHYQVHANPNYYWGTALDITFDDVDINGGRPRSVAEANNPDCTPAPCVGRATYTSQNTIVADFTAPTGGLETPNLGDVITQTTITLEGWALDEGSGVESAYFQVNYNHDWIQVGPLFDSTFVTTDTISYEWDWCADGVPNGPVSFALHVEDEDGNVADLLSLRHVLKNSTCTPPPPLCSPAVDQVALFTQPNYAGECITLNAGVHLITNTLSSDPLTSLSPYIHLPDSPPLTGRSVSSIMVGDNARVTLYRELLLRGRAQTFYASDSNLSDNWSGTEEIVVAVVEADTANANPPVPAWPVGVALAGGGSVSLVWDDGGGAAEFQARYTRSGDPAVTSTWQSVSVWNLGSLLTGSYSWEVRARNANGTETGWSPVVNFTVGTAPSVPASVTFPYTTSFETGVSNWQTNGLWNMLDYQPAAHEGTFAAWYGTPAGDFETGNYDTGTPNTGDLTSPPIPIPGAGTPYLRFWSWYETETGSNWDQRWVQISVNGGPFTSTYQMMDDPTGIWVQSSFIDLSSYAGQTIRIRFHFETLDARYNGFHGWLIDDFQVQNMTLPSCIPDEGGTMNYGDSIGGVICPAGDVDVFTFTGTTGDRIGVNVDAQSVGSSLDPVLSLLASDGTSLVTENDDEVPSTLIDPLINFTLPWDGDYALELRAWNHPGVGDSDHFYTMTLLLDPDAPSISDLSPAGSLNSNFFVQADSVISITVNAADVGSGLERVDFYFHSGDWENDMWTLLGTDSDGSDGWALPGGWDTTPLADQLGMAVYARAADYAGNVSLVAAWNLALDRVPPQTTVVALPPVLDTTAISLEWSSTDNVAPLREYDIQWSVDGAPYTLYQDNVMTTTTQIWVIGELGSLYGFRVRAVDQAGNFEPFNNGTNVTTTYIEPCDEPDQWDEGENSDDTYELASAYLEPQIHNFCDVGDEDWVQVFLEANTSYFILTTPVDPSTAAVIELYAEDGTTRIDQVYPQDPNGQPTSGTDSIGLPTLLIFHPDTTGNYYLRMYHPVSNVVGSAVRYQLVVNSHQLFLPITVREP